ncbi:MAG: GTP cyclohydrolase FolE2 [Bdellovibrionota bacterium]
MSSGPKSAGKMPDVAMDTKATLQGKINRVGMTEIELPVLFEVDSQMHRMPAKASAFVSLDKESVKGIHMSRLFSRLQQLADAPLTAALLESVVKGFQESHEGSSLDSELRVAFQIMKRKTSLLSNMSGWRHYPIECVVIFEEGHVHWHLKYSVAYSSTCPCSAALSRQLIQEKFQGDFAKRENIPTGEISDWLMKEDSVCATPHSQRSFANVSLKLKKTPQNLLSAFEAYIDETERSLKTPVQSFVKRADEQEFARLNAENLMFCEDAARRLQALFKDKSEVASFCIEVEHQESLHPHNAVAKVWSELS